MEEMVNAMNHTNFPSSITLKSYLSCFYASSLFILCFKRTSHPCKILKGFLIIPKKVEQNQTKVFDRDKLASIGNYTVPNSISDSNKNSNSFKIIKGATNSSSRGLSEGIALSNATNYNSSNQLNGSAEVASTTFFSTTNFTNITSQVGSIVEIPCTVHHLGEGTVSVRAT
jgi:hypothetical protein